MNQLLFQLGNDIGAQAVQGGDGSVLIKIGHESTLLMGLGNPFFPGIDACRCAFAGLRVTRRMGSPDDQTSSSNPF
jgi:hypothetical protein